MKHYRSKLYITVTFYHRNYTLSKLSTSKLHTWGNWGNFTRMGNIFLSNRTSCGELSPKSQEFLPKYISFVWISRQKGIENRRVDKIWIHFFFYFVPVFFSFYFVSSFLFKYFLSAMCYTFTHLIHIPSKQYYFPLIK